MADEFRTMAANIFGALDGPIATTSDVIDGLNAEIERWKGFLDDIRDAANLKLGGMVDDMVAANAELLASIEANRLAFVSATNAVNTFAGGDANGEFSGVTSADRKLASFGSTADEAALALDRFIASLDAPRPGGATSNSTVTAAPPTTTARIVSTVRRYNGALTPRTY